MNLIAIAVADYVGFMLLIALLFSSRIRRSAKLTEYRIFSVIAILSAVACCVDFIMFFCDGKDGIIFRLVNLLGNTYCFVANPIFAIGWCMFTEVKLFQSRTRIRKRYKYLSIPGFVLMGLSAVNLFYPIVFYLDENNVYHRLPLSYFYYVVASGYMVYSVYLVKSYEKRYGKLRFFPMALMLGPIALGCLLQNLFYGVSLIWVSLSVGMTSIYMSLQNEFSYLDPLTGLYNRSYLDYYLKQYARDPASRLGGIMIDVDYFKKINDTYGHSTGDEALVDVSRVLSLAKPDKAIVARFAGDEFMVLMKDSTSEALDRIIQGIKDEVVMFNENEERQYKLSLSMGSGLFDPDKDNEDSFFKRMDEKMYQEKGEKHAER